MEQSNSNMAEELCPVMRQVVLRALCDALGYTNLPVGKREHIRVVKEAQSWFLEESQLKDFRTVCEIADLNPDNIRTVAKNLIQAKFSGDFSRVPEFWRIVFAGKRHPNLSNIERALDLLKKKK